jgi:hypothetical protein
MRLATGESVVTGLSQQAERAPSSFEEHPRPLLDSRSATTTANLGALYLGGCLGFALLYAVAVYLINPVRDFASASPFPAVRSDYRAEKIDLFDRFLAASGPADGLILGSSRSMLLNGERLRAQTGRSYFNFGLASAKAEDLLAALRWVTRRQGHAPRHVILGVDVESLRDAQAHGDSLHPLRELATGPELPLSYARTLASRIFTWSYARDAAFSVYLSIRPRPAAVRFALDGTLQYAQRDAQRRAGIFSLEAGMAGCMADCRTKIESTRELSPIQVRYLRETVRELSDSGARVTLWLTGPHPRTAEHMADGTAYAQLVEETKQLLRHLQSPNVVALDLHDPSSYGGDSASWYDCNHFDDSVAIRVERLLMKTGDE